MGGARGAHLLATAQLDDLEGRQMRETRRHAAAAVLQAYHRGGEARAARQRWGLLTGETSIAELTRTLQLSFSLEAVAEAEGLQLDPQAPATATTTAPAPAPDQP